MRLLHSHPCEFAILPLHRTSQVSCPSPDSTTGEGRQLAEQPKYHAQLDSQQTFNPPPPPLSLVSTARPQRSIPTLFLPPKRQTDISLPTRPPTQQPSTLLLHPPRRLPPQFANIYFYSPTPSGLHCNPLPRRPWTSGDVEQVSSTSHDDRQGPRQGQGQARDRDKALRHITVHRLKHDTDKHVHYCTVWPPPDCGIRPLPLRARSSDTAQSIPPPAPPSP